MKVKNLPTNDRANVQARGRKPTPLLRERLPNEAPPQLKATWEMNPGHYKPGDGDHYHQTVRPGADDHLQYKSVSSGGATTYPRSHK